MNNVKVTLLLLLGLCQHSFAFAQTAEPSLTVIEQRLESIADKQKCFPLIHGILRGKYEYQPQMGASRFEVRNARLSAEGSLPFKSSYKMEIDLCDETAIKMKDAWVKVNPVSALRITLGQQRMPFSIDAHRNPSAQHFVNRSFIAKQVGDVRDVGAAIGYDFFDKGGGKVLSIDAGLYNGSNLDNQKTAWFTSPAYSARIQYFPFKGLAVIPSFQHQFIAGHKASYTSIDLGAYYEWKGLHLEAEFLRKIYGDGAFDDCNAINAMAVYQQSLRGESSLISHVSYLLRYDYMDDHSDGKSGFEETANKLILTDTQRHRFTVGLTLHLRNRYFPTDIRLNYEKYLYPHGKAPKESELDKIAAELMIRF